MYKWHYLKTWQRFHDKIDFNGRIDKRSSLNTWYWGDILVLLWKQLCCLSSRASPVHVWADSACHRPPSELDTGKLMSLSIGPFGKFQPLFIYSIVNFFTYLTINNWSHISGTGLCAFTPNKCNYSVKSGFSVSDRNSYSLPLVLQTVVRGRPGLVFGVAFRSPNHCGGLILKKIQNHRLTVLQARMLASVWLSQALCLEQYKSTMTPPSFWELWK